MLFPFIMPEFVRFTLPIVVVLAFCFPSFAQPVDTLVVQALMDSSRGAREMRQYHDGLAFLRKARSLYAQADPDLLYLESTNLIGANYYFLGIYDSADFYWASAHELVSTQWPERHIDAARFLNNRFLIARRTGDLEQARIFAEEALRLKRMELDPDDPELFVNYNNLGSLYRYLGLYDKSEETYKRALALTDSAGQVPSRRAAVILSNLGILLAERWDYDSAIEMQERALGMRQAILDSLHPEIANSYDAIGNAYEKVGDYARARDYHEKALRLREQVLGTGHDEVAKSHFNIGLDALRVGQYDQAQYHNERALEIFRQVYGDIHPLIARVLDQLGSVFDLKREFGTSIRYHEAALEMVQALYGKDHYEVGRIYVNVSTTYSDAGMREKAVSSGKEAIAIHSRLMGPGTLTVAWYWGNLGEIYMQFDEHDSALHCFQEALVRMDAAIELDDILQVPKQAPLGFGNELFRIMSAKGTNLLAMAKGRRDSMMYLKASLASYQRAAGLVDTLRLHYGRPDSRHTLANEARGIYSGGIAAAWRLYQHYQDPSYLESVFYFAERSRSMELMQTLHQNQALQFAGLPTDMLGNVQRLGTQIAAREKEVYETEAAGEKIPAAWEDEIFALQLQYDRLMQDMESAYPAYHALKYGQSLPALAEIQAKLPADCAMLTFIQTGTQTFGLRLETDAVQMLNLGPVGDIDTLVQRLRNAIPHAFRGAGAEQPDWQSGQFEMLETGYALYIRLLAPFEQAGDSLPERLIIIPQGILSLLPFDALSVSAPVSGQSFRETPFLLRDHEVAMAYSAAQWLAVQTTQSRQSGRDWAGFAPSFGEAAANISTQTRGDLLQPLAFNQYEVEAIHSFMGGASFVGMTASEATFKEQAGQYAILHLSSHAFVDPQNALYSGIAFTPEADSLEDGFLELAELFTLQLPAEMAVLSACETNLGAYIRGEGVMSLARGFAYAGVGSVVATLWQVNDAATARIMESFYGGLKRGQRKSEALRAAKLAYLDQADNLSAHPYFWSGFVPIGNMQPLATSPASWWWAVILLLGSLLTSGLIWRRRSAR